MADAGTPMAWTLLLPLALALTCFTAAVARDASLSGFLKPSEWSAIDNMERSLKTAAALPRQSQKVVLAGLGDALVSIGEGSCNLFGGSATCVPVPPHSDYATTCNSTSQSVDCAFRLEAEEHVSKNPDANLGDRVSKDGGYPPCPRCYSALHNFWCAQTVPACGTFDKVVDEILPLLSSVVLRKEKVAPALQQAVPGMLQAMSLGLPCKKMCDAITNTCGCGMPATFGEVMTALEHSQNDYNTGMSAGTSREIFHKVWDKPVCELFAEETFPGFEGICQVPVEVVSCGWCKGTSRPTAVHQQVVAQLAQSFSGIMQGGLGKILNEAGGNKKGGQQSWSWNQRAPAEPKKTKSGHTLAFILITLVVVLAAVAVAISVRIHHSRQVPSQYIDLNSLGYTPPIL